MLGSANTQHELAFWVLGRNEPWMALFNGADCESRVPHLFCDWNHFAVVEEYA
jgi:hypothetical protein